MTREYVSPIKIDLLNKSAKEVSFVPYRENENFPIKPNSKVTFYVEEFEQALYYERQLSKDIVIGNIAIGSSSVETGSYDLANSTFSANASFNIIQTNCIDEIENNALTQTLEFNVFGTLPYSDETPSIGMPAGNRFTTRFACPVITEKSDLPGGKICVVDIEGGTHQEYTKAAFEDDGSMVNIINANPSTKLTITINWTDSLTSIYVFNFANVKLGKENETFEDVENLEILLQDCILENISDKEINVPIYHENLYVTIASGDKIIFTPQTNEEVLYYFLQANKNLVVSQ